jgi:hypothetical protein
MSDFSATFECILKRPKKLKNDFKASLQYLICFWDPRRVSILVDRGMKYKNTRVK